MANMACMIAVLMYVLQLGMLFAGMLIACAAGASTSRCAAGCVQMLMCVYCSRRHRMAGVAYDVVLLMYVLQLGMLFAGMLIACAAGASTSRCAVGC